MKKFFGIMAAVFFILAIIFYVNSIRTVSYGRSTLDVANIQMTVFAAASAVLCVVNLVGALLAYKIETEMESLNYNMGKMLSSESDNTSSGSMLSNAVRSLNQEKKLNEWTCICGASNSNTAAYCYRCRRSRSEINASKIACPHCGAMNRTSNTVCFACNKPLTGEEAK